MRRKRLFFAALLALGLAPGVFVRTIPAPANFTAPVTVERLAIEPVRSGPFTLVAAWHLSSRNDHFGGYSALIERADGTLLAASDAGRLMVLDRPDRNGARPPRLRQFGHASEVDKFHFDIESLTQDPARGTLWAGFEWANAIKRFGPDFRLQARIRPPEMAGWGANSGPEAMARLSDGRFLVIEERPSGTPAARHHALLFADDPTDGRPPVALTFAGVDGYRPVDLAPLPDGRALVLFRKIGLGWPIRFTTLIGMVDPRSAGRGAVLRTTPLADLADRVPEDNYEGMAVTEEADGKRHVWLISDDNFARYQRTLLLKLRWDAIPDGNDKRRAGRPARP